ncbi:SDR family NAD(P)-dependent oxidoreductase [Paracoccus gahaiensis]|uniref:SDR family NAD(P)-dependent oxidoreductase n=1 Tax=Paracoccus gahaiensis TaxID=1706839 RepID=A0A4V5MX75_9RHOB|nr:type I polyketide synthase [Paracoccus gahaiensis]TJZ93808.1 SDR family NAD(P)-dependent oxidoreductase [Paracoccus gahaiensis]
MPKTPLQAPSSQTEGPVISGIGCRVPGARGRDRMWQVLRDGRCTIGTLRDGLFDPDLYADPFQNRRGKAYSLASGQLDDVFRFDAGFFGITPREAIDTDPQQRLMLQTVWEAIEDAGLSPRDLAGPRTGVFVGASLVENLWPYYSDTARSGSSFSLGNTLCIIANRVSSVFDFGGPSYVLDAACASSLFAMHQASEAIRTGQVDTAIVGGVHVLMTPGGFVGFSQARMMSPTGLCRTFDAGADGYVRSEACVALVLQHPDVADRMMARRRARLLATGVNTDGGASALTVPSAARQESLLDEVLDRSGCDPDDLSFYEAHGTGTQVGDPVEARAIGQAIGQLRRAPLLLGSAKTNFGHAEPAAGLVGLAKVLLAMQHRALPASLHFSSPNPNIDFDGLNLRVNTALLPLGPGRLVAGLNSFGFGGTNVAAILAEAPPPAPRLHPVALPPPPEAPWLLLSAASQGSLDRLAAGWAGRLRDVPEAEGAALCAAAAVRMALPHRLALPLPEAMSGGLLAEEEGPLRGLAGRGQARGVLAFPGNGAQVPGMGVAEYRLDPIFRATFDEVADAMAAMGVGDLAGLLHAPDLAERLSSPLVAQPLLFGLQIAQARSLLAAGLDCDAVIGHSVGEIAALHVAGCLDLRAAARIIVTRSTAFEALRGQGGMAVLAASEADVTRAMAGLDLPDLAIAAVNSPRSVTVAGSEAAIARLARVSIAGKRLPLVRLKVEIPYHSPLVEPLRDRFMADLAGLVFAAPRMQIGASALGRVMRPGDMGLDYLWRNARDPVRFADAAAALAKDGPCHLVEVSPTPVFPGNIRDIARFGGVALEHFQPQPPQDGTPPGRQAARAWVAGVPVRPEALGGSRSGPAPDMPAYPWDEQDYRTQPTPDGLDVYGAAGPRPLAGRRAEVDAPLWVTDMTPSHPAWLADHKVGGRIVLAAATLVEMALGAAASLWPDQPLQLLHFDILAPAVIEGDGLRIRTRIDEASGALTLQMRPRLSEVAWVALARGVVRRGTALAAPHAPSRRGRPQDPEDLYDDLAAVGLDYGPAFRRMAALQTLGAGSVRLQLAPAQVARRFLLDPTALDGAFHGLAAILPALRDRTDPAARELAGRLHEGATLLPTRMGHLQLYQPGVVPHLAQITLTRHRRRSLLARIALFDAQDTPVAVIEDAEFSVVHLDAATRIAPLRLIDRRVRLRLPDDPVRLPRKFSNPARLVDRLTRDHPGRPGPLDVALSSLRAAVEAGQGQDAALALALHQDPDLADDLRAMMIAAEGRDPRDTALHGLVRRRLWSHAGRILRDLLRLWPQGQRCSLLILGLPDVALLRELADDARLDDIRVAAADPGDRSLLVQVLPPDLMPWVTDSPAPGGSDLILIAGPVPAGGMVAEALAPGGLALALRPAGAPQIDWPEGDLEAEGLTLRLSAWRRTPDPMPAQVAQIALDLGPAAPLPEDLAAALQGCKAEGKPSHRVLTHLHRPGMDLTQGLVRAMMAVKAALSQPGPPILLIAADPDNDPDFAILAAGLRSIMVTAANEAGALAIRLLTLTGPAPDAAALARLIALTEAETAAHSGRDGLTADRVQPLSPRPDAAPALHLDQRDPGRLDSLGWQPLPLRAPRAGEVEIEVAATGLNFRDVMSARGLLSERILDAGASGAGMGMEYAGTVRRAGPGVDLAAGTQVMGFAASAFATRLILPAASVTTLPDGIDPDAAAGLPVAFVTAWEALRNLAALQPGETVLIHGGAGGVGLAAIQIARLVGARVFATAGTPEKRALARATGAEAAFDSRDLGFAADLMRATGGRGVDVVLNSLSGEAMARSVDCLAPFGRFVELGKRDYLEGTQMDLRPFARNLTYFGMDLDQRLAADPDRVRAILAALRAAFATGALRPVPVTPFPAEMAEEAFRHMLAARHSGKIVIRPPCPRLPLRRPVRDAWVILGGTGGLGLRLARWLLDQGSAHVHLLSRGGEIRPGNGRIGRWAQSAATVSVHAVDATDPRAMEAFLDGLQGQRVGGVIHAAMVLRDRLLRDLDPVEAGQVIRAKLGVAQVLAGLLRQGRLAPDHVVLFSSIAAYLGNPGQVAYSAANCALAALARQLRDEGHPVRALGWGALRDAGYLTRNAAVALQLSRMEGLGFLSTPQLLAELGAALRDPQPGDHVLAPLHWGRLAPLLPGLGSAMFGRLVAEGAALARAEGELADRLRQLDWPAALALVEAELRDILSAIMRLPPDQFDPHRPFNRYGIDSLMAMELRLDIERRFGTALSSLPVTEEMTAARLAAVMVERIRTEGDPGAAPPPGPEDSE